MLGLLPTVQAANDSEDDYVQEVLQENQDQHVNDDHATMSDDEYNRRQEEMLRRQRDEAERIRQQEEHLERERNERIEQEREAAFQAELAQLADDKKQKSALLQQKKRDAAMVQRVLKAAHAGNHYAVLGLRNNRELRIPGRSITLLPGSVTWNIPEIVIGPRNSPAQIKRAYRERAKAVHPDKSRDGRAVEAFHAIENAASILLDETARAEYDAAVRERRRARRARVSRAVRQWVGQGFRVGIRVVGFVKNCLGPFAVPVFILAVLIV